MWSQEKTVPFAPSPEIINLFARQFMDANYHIHFHTWTPVSFMEFLSRAAAELRFPMVVDVVEIDGLDMMAVISKV